MAKMFTMDIDTSSLDAGLKKFFKVIDPKAREKGLFAFGLQLLNNTVNGSPNEASRPPIKDGRLRGSGSVFVGNKKVGDTSTFSGTSGGTPATSSGESNPNVITVGFNTEYAARMHEHLEPYGTPDPWFGKTLKAHMDAADVTGKFLERHLKADKEELFFLYAKIYRKFAGT